MARHRQNLVTKCLICCNVHLSGTQSLTTFLSFVFVNILSNALICLHATYLKTLFSSSWRVSKQSTASGGCRKYARAPVPYSCSSKEKANIDSAQQIFSVFLRVTRGVGTDLTMHLKYFEEFVVVVDFWWHLNKTRWWARDDDKVVVQIPRKTLISYDTWLCKMVLRKINRKSWNDPPKQTWPNHPQLFYGRKICTTCTRGRRRFTRCESY